MHVDNFDTLDLQILTTFQQLSTEQKIDFLLSLPDLLKTYEINAGKKGLS